MRRQQNMPAKKPSNPTARRAPMRRTRPPKNWREVFLRELAIDGNRKRSAEAAHVHWTTAYEHRAADAAFRAQWDDAVDHAGEYLEAEAFRRATEGWDEPLTCSRGLIYTDDGQVATVRKYSDSLLSLLLKAARPEKYRENVKVSGSIEHSLVPRGEARALADELLDAVRDMPDARAALSVRLLASGE